MQRVLHRSSNTGCARPCSNSKPSLPRWPSQTTPATARKTYRAQPVILYQKALVTATLSSGASHDRGTTICRRVVTSAICLLGCAYQAKADAIIFLADAQSSVLPKGYQETSLKLVQSLTKSITTDLSGAKEQEVRRVADPAKDLVKSWVQRWKDDGQVVKETSHKEIQGTLQQLGEFYMRNGQRARLPQDLGQQLLDSLAAAEADLQKK